MTVARRIPDWAPVGYTLARHDDYIRAEFKREHPGHSGELRITTMADGFSKIEFRGVVLTQPSQPATLRPEPPQPNGTDK